MNNEAEVEARARPLSTGLWTLFSWLRRDERSDSSDSLSSAGSDRTVASFAFLTPAHYQPATAPFVLPPPGPPTDSYKKRVHDRNLRRQYDRDITLHRKYGLFKSGEATCGYDAFSLPPARRINGDSGSRWDRDRRATSECYQRRLAHVPGKRRAPLPPVTTAPTTPASSLTRRTTRKRRAPQPPVKFIEKSKVNIQNVQVKTIVTQMNPQPPYDKSKLGNNETFMGCKSEKYSKKEGSNKDTKVKSEKSFLKQIFDSKKRNSGIDISSVKLLPSISELDKQAADIIETCKLNPSEQNNNVKNIILGKADTQRSSHSETWICVSCLRKYNLSIITCPHCLPNDGVPSTSKATNSFTQTEKNLPGTASTNKGAAEEKQKLKEMLKEMKDSLPKRPKHDNKTDIKTIATIEAHGSNSYSTETPTLRVGCSVQNEHKTSSGIQSMSENIVVKPASPAISPSPLKPSPSETTRLATSVLVQPSVNKYLDNNNSILESKHANINNSANEKPLPNIQKGNITEVSHIGITEQFKDKKDLNTPLKISSLLNPVYVPKKLDSNKLQMTNTSQTASKITNQKIDGVNRMNQPTVNITASSSGLPNPTESKKTVTVGIEKGKIEQKKQIEYKQNNNAVSVVVKKDKTVELEPKDNKMPSATTKEQSILKDNVLNQHSRRRELIHQLEQSIARGDERAAAEAAAKLAQLRLSCSVLSFSSQILSEPSTSTANSSVEADLSTPNRLPIKMNLPTEQVTKEPEGKQFSSVKERSPTKVSKPTASTGLLKTNLTTTPPPNTVPLKDKPLQNTQESIIKKILLQPRKENPPKKDTMITISVLVEDREATRGPVQLRIRRDALMRDLRREAETSLGLATNLQRWIVGRVLCVNDNTPVASLAGTDFSAPFYLCVVESETKTDPASRTKTDPASRTNIVENSNKGTSDPLPKASNVYTELMQLEQQALVPNAENFECGVCMVEYLSGQGVVLRECVHIFCKECLADVVHHCEEPDVPCPAMGCRGMLQEREIRALVTPQDYERWLARGLAAAESGTRNAFHCRTRDCKGWALCEPGVQRFPCPVCKHINCVPCQAIHDGETCEQHRTKLKQAAAGNTTKASDADDGTRTLLNSLIAKGEALECPECSAIITKKWGCDWVKCSACKTEICWVTRGRRWGPGGKGDTSGGCRCGVDGKRCHPSCGYCH